MDEYVAKKPRRYKKLVMGDKVCIPTIYCITIASNDKNMLDIISCNELLFKHYKRTNVRIVGLAASYSEAVNLVMKIVLDVYNKTENYKVRDYLIRGFDSTGCD